MTKSPLALMAVLLGSAFAAPAEPAARTTPNIILVFIDDMGWADFSCFGNTDAVTPTVDRMAAEGIAFESFYVNSPICSPSRVAISTGTYPQRWRITSYLAHSASNNKRGIANWLDPKAPMLARSLKQAGYATGHFGKWHMGGQRDVTDAPAITEYGFDESLTNFEGMGPKLLPLTINKDGKKGKIWGDAVRLGQPVTWMQRSEITTGFVDASISFMKKAQEAGKPFYVNLWPDDVHSPFWPSYERIKKTNNKRELYLAVLEEMDKQFAKLFDFIRSDEELHSNTIVLVCSDNGPEKGAGRAGAFQGFKTHLYEGGIRSPLIVWAPGLMSKRAIGTRNTDSVFSAIDLTPSLLKLAGGKPPINAHYDGEMLLDVLLGKSKESRKKPIYFSRPPDRKDYYGFKNLPDLAVRQGKWKVLCDYDGSRPELYDLSADPGESKNIADKQPVLTKELGNKVVTWYKSISQGQIKHAKKKTMLKSLNSPILLRGNDTAYRDPAVLYHDKTFYLFCTLVQTDPDKRIYSYTVQSESNDLRSWSEPRIITPKGQDLNYSSPGNVVRFQGEWVLCLQTYPRPNYRWGDTLSWANSSARIYIMRSQDLQNWSAPELLHVKGPNVPEAQMGRMIDPYLLQDKDDLAKWWCFFKQKGVSYSWSRDLKNWEYAGRTASGENVCVLVEDNAYLLFHSPRNGIGVMRSRDLKDWTLEEDLITLGQSNWPWAENRLTAGAVLDLRDEPSIGKCLMFFHGGGPGKRKTQQNVDANCSIGIAWSDDLTTWDWPGKATAQQ